MIRRIAATVGVIGVLAVAGPAGAVGPLVQVTPAETAPGGAVHVELDGWPESVVTAQVCGNGARRGSSDCDQIGGESIRIPVSGHENLRVRVQAPPVGCPCVVRVSTVRGEVVRTVPISVAGIPDGVDLAPAQVTPAATALRVRATVAGPGGPLGTVGRALGVVSRRTLVLSVRNGSSIPATDLRLAGSVGRPGRAGTPLSAVLPTIEPGAVGTARVPFGLPFPASGPVEVRGVVAGLDVPIPVVVTTTSDPWLAELGLPVLLLVVARLARRRSAHRSASVAPRFESTVPQVSTECSPLVGAVDDGYWESAPYHPSPEGPVLDLPPVSAATPPALELV